jgi:uncharacterized protein (TIGR02588 family)
MADDAAGQARDNEEGQGHESSQNGGISIIEWLVAVVGLALVVGTIVTLSVEALRDGGRPPNLTFEVIATSPVNGGYVVEIEVLNDGDQTAADLNVIGQIVDGETVVEERELTFDYVPPHSARRGGMFFSNDPDTGTLVLAPVGYQDP